MGEFVEFLKTAEGFRGEVYDDVGAPAVGYGHRVRSGEDFGSGVDEDTAHKLLVGDVRDSIGHARRAVENVAPGVSWDSLDRDAQLKLTERAFNMGPDFYKPELSNGTRGFPKWTDAVINGDRETELAEHHRHSGGMPLTSRNDAYEDFFHGTGRGAAPREATRTKSSEEERASSDAGKGSLEGAGTPPPSSMEGLLEKDEFRSASPSQQAERFYEVSPTFRKLYDEDPAAANEWLSAKVEAADPDVWESLEGGWDQGVGMFQWTLANAAMLIDELGIENDYEESWREAAEINFLDAEDKIGSDWYDKVMAVVGGLPGGLAVPAAATGAAYYALPALGVGSTASAALYMPLGMGSAGALAAADQGWWEAAKRGTIDAALGAIYPATAHLGRFSRASIEGSAAYMLSQADDQTQRGIEAGAIAVLAGLPGRAAPFAVMEKLGVKNPETVRRKAMVESRRQMEANARSTIAGRQIVQDAEGNTIGSLSDLHRTYGQVLRGEHPMSVAPQERSYVEQSKLASRVKDSMEDPSEIHAADGSKSKHLQAGPEHVDNRRFTVSEDAVEPFFGKKYIRAGEVIEPLMKAFKIPIKGWLDAKERLTGVQGWYKPWSRDMRHRTRKDVQTAAHEWGHDISFRDETLNGYMAGKPYEDSVRAISDLLSSQGVKMGKGGTAPVNEIFKAWKQGNLPAEHAWLPEFLSVSYDRTDVHEGVAEMIRLWTTNNKAFGGQVDIKKQFPNAEKILNEWKDALPRGQRRAVEKFQKQGHEHLAMNGDLALASSLGPDANPAAVMSTRLVRLRQAYTDDLAGILNLEQQVHGGISPGGVYETMRLLRGLGEAADGMMYYGAPRLIPDPKSKGQFMLKFQGDGLAQIFGKHGIKNTRKLSLAMRYVTARQAAELKKQTYLGGRVRNLDDLDADTRFRVERMNETREKLFSEEEIQSGLNLAKKHPEFKPLFDDLNKFASRVADFGQTAGLWSKGQRANWKRTQFVFSFFREMDEAAGGGSTSANMLRGERPFQTQKGSSRNLKDPFQLLLETHGRTFKLAMENMAKKKLVDTITRAQGGGRFGEIMTPIKEIKDLKVTDIRQAAAREMQRQYPFMNPQQIDDFIDSHWKLPEDIEKITMHTGNMTPHGPDVMTVFYDGKPKYFKLHDPTMIASIRAMRRPNLVGVEKYWNNARRLKQRFITLAPGFIAANFARDVAMASIMSKTGNVHLGKSLKGFWGALRHDADYRDFIANGGGAAGVRESLESQKGKLIRHAQRTGFDPKRLMLDTVSVHRFLDELSRASEVASRLGEYKAARKQGARASHAAYLGREVSTDFGMRGDSKTMNFFSNTVPFFNAMVESGDRMFRAYTTDPSHRLATGVKMGSVAMAGMALYGLNRTIPQYMDLPDWDKWGYWHFFLPKWSDGGERERVQDGRFAGQLDYHHFKMPKLWEVGILSSLGERTLQHMWDDEDPDVVDLAADATHLIGQNFGLNLFDRAFPLPIPVGLDVVAEQWSNRILFTGNPIESQAMANLELWRRSRPDGSRALAESAALMRDVPGVPDMVKSPARAEAFLRGIFGEFATMGLGLADSVLFPGGPSKRLDQMPVVSRFYEGGGKYSRMEQDFWERYTETTQAAATMRNLAGDPTSLDTMEEWIGDPEKMREIGLADTMDRNRQQVAQLQKYINMVKTGAFGFNPDYARKEIDRAEDQIRSLMDATMSAIEGVE